MRVRVLTYNIHRAIGVDRRFRLDRVAEIVAHHDPHVLLLQEADEGAPRSRRLNLARELAETLDFPHHEAGYNHSLRVGRYGNATLSRFPIIRSRNIDLTIQRKKRRGCLHASIDIQRTKSRVTRLEVFNLHLGLSAREREQQLGRLVRSHEFTHYASREVPVIVGGDFNDWRSRLTPIFTEILDFESATERARSRGWSSIRTYPSFSPTGSLDRLYHRGPIRLITARRCRLALSKVASDHLPVVADFRLT